MLFKIDRARTRLAYDAITELLIAVVSELQELRRGATPKLSLAGYGPLSTQNRHVRFSTIAAIRHEVVDRPVA